MMIILYFLFLTGAQILFLARLPEWVEVLQYNTLSKHMLIWSVRKYKAIYVLNEQVIKSITRSLADNSYKIVLSSYLNIYECKKRFSSGVPIEMAMKQSKTTEVYFWSDSLLFR